MFSLPNPERVELLDISNTKMKSPNLKRYTALKELYANGISATSLDLKKCRKLEYIYLNDTKYLKRLDLSKQKLLINVEFRRSNVEELDIRATTRVCDQDEGGRGIEFDDCKKLRKVIHNKNWRYLYWFQNRRRGRRIECYVDFRINGHSLQCTDQNNVNKCEECS